MSSILKYSWVAFLLLLVIHGASVIKNEWRVKLIHKTGELVEVTVEGLDCPQLLMTFRFENERHQKKIDARTCVLFSPGQKIKFKHSHEHADTFLFVNERNPNLFILGGLEMVVGIIGLLANWPLIRKRQG